MLADFKMLGQGTLQNLEILFSLTGMWMAWSEHVDIVERGEGDRVYTVEGNSGDAVRRVSYNLGSTVIVGCGLIVE